MVSRLNAMKGVTCLMPQGAFYAFPDVSGVYGKSYKGNTIAGSADLCDYFLNEHRLAIIPGIGFGADRHVRLSYAVSMANIEKALDRFEAGLNALE